MSPVDSSLSFEFVICKERVAHLASYYLFCSCLQRIRQRTVCCLNRLLLLLFLCWLSLPRFREVPGLTNGAEGHRMATIPIKCICSIECFAHQRNVILLDSALLSMPLHSSFSDKHPCYDTFTLAVPWPSGQPVGLSVVWRPCWFVCFAFVHLSPLLSNGWRQRHPHVVSLPTLRYLDRRSYSAKSFPVTASAVAASMSPSWQWVIYEGASGVSNV